MTELKLLRQKDIETVQKLAKEIWYEHYSKIISYEQIDFMLDMFHSDERIILDIQKGCVWKILWFDSQPVGYLMIKSEKEKIYLSKIYLKKEFRGRGFGKIMMDDILEYSKKTNSKSICLNVNKNNLNSIRFYENSGFKKIDEVVADIGNGFVMDDFIYEIKL